MSYSFNINDPSSSRSKYAPRQRTYRRIKMYLKSNGRVESSWKWSEICSAARVYVIISSDSGQTVQQGIIYPDDFGSGVSLHFNSECDLDNCFCPRE